MRLVESIGRIGQLQILRLNLTYELCMASKFQARQLSSALSSLNSALMTEFAQQCLSMKSSSTLSASELMPSVFKEESPLLFELSNYLEYNGYSDPLFKIYIHSRLPANLDTIVLLLLISQLPKFVYIKETSALGSTSASLKSGESVDGIPFVLGLLTLLRQFHSELTNQFLKLSSQFVTACIPESTTNQAKQSGIPIDATNMLHFLQHFILFGRFKRQQIAEYLPAIVLDQFHSLNLNTTSK